jgi:hypothetical protein
MLLVEEIQLTDASQGLPRFRGTVLPIDIRKHPDARPILKSGAQFDPRS